jgi:hypothetical protein
LAWRETPSRNGKITTTNHSLMLRTGTIRSSQNTCGIEIKGKAAGLHD